MINDSNASTLKAPRSLRTLTGATSSGSSPSLVALSISAALVSQPIVAVENNTASEVAAGEQRVVLDTLKVEDKLAPDASPYANPSAPYKAEESADVKYTQPLVDTPKSIIVVPKEVIRDSGATTLKEVMRVQPGVTLGTGEGGNAFGDRFIIRGFEARNDVFVDGLRDPGVTSRETFAVEQIEIAKGPSSTFAGRGTTGGAVNSVTKMPGSEAFSRVEGTLGTDEYKRLTFDTNQVINDQWSVRFNAMAHDAEVAGRDHVFDERNGAAVALKFEPTDAARIILDYYYLNTDSLPDWGVPYDVASNRPFKVDRDNFYGLLKRDYWETDSNIGTIKVEVDLTDDLTVSSQTRYGRTSNAYIASAPESPCVNPAGCTTRSGSFQPPFTVSANAKTRDQENKYFGHQTNLVADIDQGSLKHTVVSGLEFTNEDISNTPPSADPRAVFQDLYNPRANIWTGTITSGANTNEAKVDSWAVYLMDTIELSEAWQVFGGVRHDNYDIETKRYVSDYEDTNSNFENDSSFWNWHAGIVYKPVENGTIYLSYATSSNPSGEQLDATAADYGGLTATTQDLDPERNKSYELGTKWELFEDRLALNFALFQIDKTNARVTTGSGPTLDTEPVGEHRVRGFEIGMAGKATDALSIYSGLTVLDTEITNSIVAAQEGKAFPNVADRSAYVQTKYQLTPALAFGGTVTYTDEIFGGTVQALDTRIPSWTRWDLMGEYQITDKWVTRLNVLNVTDKEYYDTLYRSATPFTYVAPGRSVLLSTAYTF